MEELDDEIRLYKELGDHMKEWEKDGSIPPDSIDWDLDEGDADIYTKNPQSQYLYHRFITPFECAKCHRKLQGSLIIEKQSMRLHDSGNFVIFDHGLVCLTCLKK